MAPVEVQRCEKCADAFERDLPRGAAKHFLALAAVDAFEQVVEVARRRLLVALETQEGLEFGFVERLILQG